MTPREERKARNVYNESLRRAQAGDTSSYVRGEMDRYGISDPSTTPFRGSGAGNLNQSIDTGKKYFMGLAGGAQRGLDALTQGVAMANENERWFKQNAPNAKRYAGVPMDVRESVQTGRDKSFYDKYMNLARLAQDTTQRQYYLDQADTARRNLQITKRINYGMGELGLDETPFKGYESYHDGSRFDIDRFTEAMSEYLPGGEDITEDLTDTIISPHDIETEDAYSGFPGGFRDERIPQGPFPPGIAYPGYNEDITITDLPEDITETITEDDFVLKESKFPQGNLGTEGNYDYNPIWDLNIMNIQDYELKKKATDAAIQFNNLWKSKEGQEDKSDMYELERLYDEYMDAVKEGAQPLLEDITSQIEDMNFQFDDALEDQADLLNRIEALKNENRANNMLFDI